jgi:DNA-binding NarL/FixJ family response regulator
MGEEVMAISVMVVDGHHIVREGLVCLLHRLDEIGSVEQAASGEEALRKAREMEPAPRLVVMDLRLEGILHGIDLAAAFRREVPDASIMVLTDERHRGMVEAAIQAGASGYLLKTSTFEDFKQALTTITEGKTYLSPEISRMAEGNGANGEHPLRMLSRRERQVLTLIARGGTTKSIAHDLGISPKTVEKHRGKLARKLDIHSVAELTRFAIENELA